MTSELREERVHELSESAYVMLKESHDALRELKGLVDRLHTGCLQQPGSMDFDTMAAIKLTTDRMYDELERYLRPECDPDSAYDAARTEKA